MPESTTGPNSADNLTDKEKAVLQIRLEEYKACSGGISQQVTIQGQAITIGVAIITAFTAAVMSLAASASKLWPTHYAWILLPTPFFLSALGIWIADKDHMIVDFAGYINTVIKPDLETLCGQEVIQLDSYLMEKRFGQSLTLSEKILKALTAPFPHGLFALLSAIVLLSVLYIQGDAKYQHLSPVQWLIFGADCIFVVWFIVCVAVASGSYRKLSNSSQSDVPNAISRIEESSPNDQKTSAGI